MYLGDLKRLAIFASVARLGSFAAAARELNMARSGVSEQVGQLEQSLGVRLLHRTTRQVTLTIDGEAIYQEARKLAELSDAVREISERDSDTGRIRITSTVDIAQKWLIPRLANFQSSNPGIDYDLIISDEVLDLVAESIDIAVRLGRPRDANIIARPISLEQPRLIASPTLFERFPRPRHPDDLIDLPWVLLAPLNVDDKVTLQGPNGTVIFTPRRYSVSDSPLATNHMIQHGLGIGLHVTEMVKEEISQGKLEVVLPEWGSEMLRSELVYSSRRQLPGRVRRLIDFLLG